MNENTKKVIIVGAGSVGKFIAYNPNQFTEKYDFIGFLDDDPNKKGQLIAGIPVLGTLELLPDFIKQNIERGDKKWDLEYLNQREYYLI